MTLAELIAGQPGTDAEVLAWLNESVEVRDETLVNDRALMARLTIAECNEVFATLDTAAQGSKTVQRALAQLAGDGIDLSHDNARTMIDVLFAGNAALRDKLKAMGRKTAARWTQVTGLGWSENMEPKQVDRAIRKIAAARAV